MSFVLCVEAASVWCGVCMPDACCRSYWSSPLLPALFCVSAMTCLPSPAVPSCRVDSSLGDICLSTWVLKSVHVLKQPCETQGTDATTANLYVHYVAAAATAEPASESTDLLGQGSIQTLVRPSFLTSFYIALCVWRLCMPPHQAGHGDPSDAVLTL